MTKKSKIKISLLLLICLIGFLSAIPITSQPPTPLNPSNQFIGPNGETGNKYEFTPESATGNKFTYTATEP
jgi:hypothetical protein